MTYAEKLTKHVCANAPAPLRVSWEYPGYCDVTHPDYPGVYVAASPGWEGVPLPIQCMGNQGEGLRGIDDKAPWSGNLQTDAKRYFRRVTMALAAAQLELECA